jgi:hypothetical protein
MQFNYDFADRFTLGVIEKAEHVAHALADYVPPGRKTSILNLTCQSHHERLVELIADAIATPRQRRPGRRRERVFGMWRASADGLYCEGWDYALEADALRRERDVADVADKTWNNRADFEAALSYWRALSR